MKSFLLVVSVLFGVAYATLGIDFSMATCEGGVSESQLQCYVSEGYDFAIIEVFDGGQGANSNIGSCVSAALGAGMSHVDVYGFFCPNCGGNTPSDAISSVQSALSGVNYGTLWIDVEQCEGCWNDAESNCGYVQQIVDAATEAGLTIGIYSSEGEWSQTVGSCANFTNLPLWYAHYDGEASFADGLYNFGGWTSPFMKQYNDQGPCQISVDVNYSEGEGQSDKL